MLDRAFTRRLSRPRQNEDEDAHFAIRPRAEAQFAISGLGDRAFRIEDPAGITDARMAGDVNADGFDDLIIGAFENSLGGEDAGAGWVVFGRAGGFPAEIDLFAEGWALLGTHQSGAPEGDRAGVLVSAVGDFDGDGFDDVAVSTEQRGGNGQRGVYLVYGKEAGFGPVDLPVMPASQGLFINGATDFRPTSIAAAGDVNGDGLDDFVVGDSGDDSGGNSAGAAWIVYGREARTGSVILPLMPSSEGFKIVGDAVGDLAGASVSAAGDVNRDGYDDFLIGASHNDVGGDFAGIAYLIFGAPTADLLDLSLLSGRGIRIIGKDGHITGMSVSAAGDVNGDGLPDLLIGAPFAPVAGGSYGGAAYLIFGSTTLNSINLANLAPSVGFEIRGFGSSRAGEAVAAGDLNGDGYDDIVVGAFEADIGATRSGAVYAIYGKASGLGVVELATLSEAQGDFFVGGEFDRVGRDISVGDVNGDGFADILTNEGNSAARVILGLAPTTAVTRMGSAGGQAISGGGFDDSLFGLGGDDRLYGNGGNDSLDGGSGADAMAGGAGDDLYFVDDAGDTVSEAAGGGTDTVRTTLGNRADPAAAAYVLPAEVEILIGTLGSAQLLEDNASNNVITTGNGADFVYAMHGGVDTVSTGGGNDFLFFGATFTTADAIDGGAGTDRLGLYGDYALTFGAGSLTGIERLMLYSAPGNDFDYSLNMVDANVAAGAQLEVAALSLGAGEVLTFNGAAETDGSFWVRSGGGDDVITGGALGDRISGGLGADRLTGGGGADRFDVTEIAHSTGVNFDTFVGFDPNVDRINISGTVSQWGVGGMSGLSRANFDAELAAIVDDMLEAHGAARATATSGEFAGKIFVVVDGNGDGAYTAGADYVFAFENPAHAMLQAFPIFT